MTGRLGIDDVRPQISGRIHPAKAVVGEVVPVTALVWREGHDAVAATLNITAPDSGQTMAIHMHPEPDNQDRVHAVFIPDTPGTWNFRVDAWSDPVATWRNAVEKKIEAGQSPEELANDLAIGVEILDRAADQSPDAESAVLREAAQALASRAPLTERVAPALSEEVTGILQDFPLRELLVRGDACEVKVERRAALFNSWYELFPRSTGGWDEEGKPVHGTFVTTAQALERVARMGFDTVYLPPIHPIGEVNRKGRNNSLTPKPGDVGSPWAIGSRDGGHDAVHPELGKIGRASCRERV